jgi:hypothetical protein
MFTGGANMWGGVVPEESTRDDDEDESNESSDDGEEGGGEEECVFEIVPFRAAIRDPRFLYDPHSYNKSKLLEYPVSPNVVKDAPARIYPLDNSMGGACKVWFKMRFQSAPDAVVEFPAQLMEYVKLKPEFERDVTLMRKCDATNKLYEQHNLYVCSLLGAVLRTNGCQTSAGTVTCEPLPTSALDRYKAVVDAYMKDVVTRLRFDVAYLFETCGLRCVGDYDFENLNYLADCVSFYRKMFERVKESGGWIRVRVTGMAPFDWNVGDGASFGYSASGPSWVINNIHCAKYPMCLISVNSRFEEMPEIVKGAEWGPPCSFVVFERDLIDRVKSSEAAEAVVRYIRYGPGGPTADDASSRGVGEFVGEETGPDEGCVGGLY